MCGDHKKKEGTLNGYQGSPPHVRGPPIAFYLLLLKNGITPACAGTTPPMYNADPTRGDHPRMCGDH